MSRMIIYRMMKVCLDNSGFTIVSLGEYSWARVETGEGKCRMTSQWYLQKRNLRRRCSSVYKLDHLTWNWIRSAYAQHVPSISPITSDDLVLPGEDSILKARITKLERLKTVYEQ